MAARAEWEMKVSVGVDIVCAVCGEVLDCSVAEYDSTVPDVNVTPCQHCLEAAKAAAREDVSG
jgi:hypothetical protein